MGSETCAVVESPFEVEGESLETERGERLGLEGSSRGRGGVEGSIGGADCRVGELVRLSGRDIGLGAV